MYGHLKTVNLVHLIKCSFKTIVLILRSEIAQLLNMKANSPRISVTINIDNAVEMNTMVMTGHKSFK